MSDLKGCVDEIFRLGYHIDADLRSLIEQAALNISKLTEMDVWVIFNTKGYADTRLVHAMQ